jgi:hypothetical protein
MWQRFRKTVTQAAMCSTGFFASCNDGEGPIFPRPDEDAIVNVALTDAPVDFATDVVIEVAGVEFIPEEGDVVGFDFDPPRSFDVLELTGGDTATLLNEGAMPSGRYTGIRLLINAHPDVQDESFIDLTTGERFPLVIPQGAEASLTIDREITLERDERIDFVVDFDLRKSIIGASEQDANYIFKPVLRIVDSSVTGTLTGTVASDQVPPECTLYVYVFSGAEVVPDDMDLADDVDPLTSTRTRLSNNFGDRSFRADFLEPGSYTVSLTCDGESDTPEGEEPLVFTSTIETTIRENQTTTVTFN